MSRWAHRFKRVAFIALLGCRSSGTAQPPATTERSAVDPTRDNAGGAAALLGRDNAGGGAALPARPVESAVVRAFRLPLPAQEAFLAQSLAPEDAARAETFSERARITVGRGYLQQLDLFPGERMLLVASADEDAVRVYDRASKRELGNYPISAAGEGAGKAVAAWPELGPDGAPLFVTADANGLALFSAAGGQRLASLDGRGSDALKWSADGSVLVSKQSDLSRQSSVLHFHQRNGLTLAPVGTLEFEERVDGWDLSRDNRSLAVSHYPSDALRVIDLQSGEDVLRVPAPQFAGDVSLSPDGRWVAVGGQGLLVVDLLNPARRAFYSYLQNNIGSVRFSPGGQVLAASAYDGRVRLFRIRSTRARADDSANARRTLELSLLRELRHAGQANVYTVVFEADGAGLLSSSGDQTVRWFRAAGSSPPAPAQEQRFRTLEQWRREEPHAAAPWPAPPDPLIVDGHYQPAALEAPPRPARLRAGRYACKITSMYRMRDCFVSEDERGHTLLEFTPGNLLGLRGVVYDDGPVLRFEGWLTEPSTLLDCSGCEAQPIHGLLRGDGSRFRGVLTFRRYFDPHHPPDPPPLDTKIEEALDRYPIELVRTGGQ